MYNANKVFPIPFDTCVSNRKVSSCRVPSFASFHVFCCVFCVVGNIHADADGFGAWPERPLHPLHFDDLGWPVTVTAELIEIVHRLDYCGFYKQLYTKHILFTNLCYNISNYLSSLRLS